MSRAYYNEHDKFCAQWLRNLIRAGLIAPGDVDERSIEDVHPSDLAGYTQCHFFAGIAVWSAALRGSGWRDDRPVWTGSCPCQPFSSAGKGGGTTDERHLWPAFFHLIQTAKPPGVPLFGEQVASKGGLAWLDTVWSDMEGSGHAFWSVDLCAAGVGSSHIRQRLFFVAHTGHLEPSGWNTLRGANEEYAGAPGANGDLGEGGADQARERAVDDAPVCSPSSELADPGRLDSAGRGDMGDMGDMGEAPIRDEGAREEWQWIWDALNDGGTDVRVADPQQYNSGSQAEPTNYEWAQADGSADRLGGRGGLLGGLADADSSIAELATGQRPRPGEAQGGRSLGELERCGSLPASLTTGPVNGHWANADWLLCRDGKWRPVEPGTFPLADGPPNRVGQLRAYGNAIVKQAAEEFIQAVMPAL